MRKVKRQIPRDNGFAIIFLNEFCSVRKSLRSTASVYVRLCKNNSNVSSTPESLARFALAALSGNRSEDVAQPVFKTGVCWRGEALAD